MNVWVFPLGILALVLAAFLRAPQKGSAFRPVFFFLAGLIATAAGVRFLTQAFDIGRPTDFDYYVADAVRLTTAEPDAPVIVFSGASFSRNGLDDERMTMRLREKGLPHRVINLSLEGSSLQERHAALMRYLDQVKSPPDMVFLMVAPEFDLNSAYVFRVAKFSDRAIAQFTPEAAAWAALGMSAGVCEGVGTCAKNAVFGPLHLGMNVLNVGLLSGGRDLTELEPLKVYDARQDVREELSDEDIETGVLAEIAPEPKRGPHWASSFRMQQRIDLKSAGVTRIGYYMPPVIAADIRDYTASLCLGELADWPCIPPTDPELMAPLAGQIWFDPKHLKQDGAEHFTDWLANEITIRELLK